MPSNNSANRTGPTGDQSPYVGPRPFTTNDRDIFFGRNQEAIELTALIKAHPEVLLYAQSGAGKTSLLYAQVMPTLDLEEEFDVLRPARVRSQESSVIPDQKISNIYMFNALKDLSDDQLSVLERSQFTLADYLERRPRSPVRREGEESVKPSSQSLELRLPRVVVFDQFEEIFTLHPERYRDRENFFAQVAAALATDPFLRVVFSMREDYIAELDPYVDLMPQNLRTRFRLERLRKPNAVLAVTRPLQTERAKATGRTFTAGAAEMLVEKLMLIKVKTASGEKIEVPGEFVDPVQLQVVCQTLWQKLPPTTTEITTKDIDKYANVDEALSDFYENSVRKAVAAANSAIQAARIATSGETQVINEGSVRLWFDQKLITRENKRNMVFREAHSTAGLSNQVVDELENQHVIRVEMRGGEPWYELSHDRFIPPIRESNRRFLLQQPLAKRKSLELEERAEAWIKSHRSEKKLLNRGELLAAENWMKTDAAAIGYSDGLFSLIAASEAAIQHEDAQQQLALADALKQKAVAEHQRARGFRLGLMVASMLLLLTLGSTGFAINRWYRANAAQAEAQDNYQKAQKNYKDATAAQSVAAENSIRADRQRALAEDAATKLAETAAELKSANLQEEAQRLKAEAATRDALAKQKLATAAAATANAATESAKSVNDHLVEALDQSTAGNWADKAVGLIETDPELALSLALLASDKAPDIEPVRFALRQTYHRLDDHVVLRGHRDIVGNAIYSPDGRYIYTASEDDTVKQWDAKSHKMLWTFEGHKGGIHGLVISCDGSRIATEAADDTGRIWNVGDHQSVQLRDLSGPLAALAFSNDGRFLATEATTDEERKGAAPRIVDAATGKILQTLIGHTDAVSALAFSPNGKLLVTASWDRTARVWDVASGRQLFVLEGHTAPLTSVAFNPDGTLIVTGSYDGTARTWDARSGSARAVLKGHTGMVQGAVFSPHGDSILTNGKMISSNLPSGIEVPLPKEILEADTTPADNTVRLYDLNGNSRFVLTHSSPVSSAAFSSDGKLIVTAEYDGITTAWNALTGQRVGEFKPQQQQSLVEVDEIGKNSAVLSPDNKFLLTSGNDKTAEVWRVSLFWREPVLHASRPINTAKFLTEDSAVAIGSDGIHVWNLKTKEALPGTIKFSTPTIDAALSPDRKFAATISRNDRQHAKVINTTSQAVVLDLAAATMLTDVKYSPKQNYILAFGGNQAYLWEAASGKLLKRFGQHAADNNRAPLRQSQATGPIPKPSTDSQDVRSAVIMDAAFSFDDRYLALANRDGTVGTYELASGNPIASFAPHEGLIYSIALSSEPADDPWILTASNDKTARVCDLKGACYPPISGFAGPVTFADFSPDNSFIFTISLDGKVRVWELRKDRWSLVNEMRTNAVAFTTGGFSRDNSRLIFATDVGNLLVFECDVCQPIDKVRKLAVDLPPQMPTYEQLYDRLRETVLDDDIRAAFERLGIRTKSP